MGEIVAAIGTCHTPYLFTNPPDENPEQLKQAAKAMRELGEVLDETKPDVILFLGADHVETSRLIPTFCIIAGNKAIACLPAARSSRRITARWRRTSCISW